MRLAGKHGDGPWLLDCEEIKPCVWNHETPSGRSPTLPGKRPTAAKCDGCGAVGAFDFMGDYLCAECARKAIPSEKEPMTTQPTSPTPDTAAIDKEISFLYDLAIEAEKYGGHFGKGRASGIRDAIGTLRLAAAIREAEERGRISASIDSSRGPKAPRGLRYVNGKCCAPDGHILTDTGEVLALPEGHVAVREGGKVVVRKVPGELPVTADGVVVSHGDSVFYPGEDAALDVLRGLHDWRDTVRALNESGHETRDDGDLPEWIGYRSYYEHDTGYGEEAAHPLSMCYSTREAAEAARKGTPDAR